MGQEEKHPNTVGRAYLEKKLRERGLSRRRAKRVLNAVIEEMKQALRRGEEVEFPFGKLERFRHKHRKRRARFFGRVMTQYKKPYTVKLRVDGNGEQLLKQAGGKAPSVSGSPKKWLVSHYELVK